MKPNQLSPSAIVANWKRDKNYKNKMGFNTKWPEFVNFKEGIQWTESAKAKWKNFTFITINQCNFIIKNRKSNILSRSLKVVFEPEEVPEGQEELEQELSEKAKDFTALAANTWEDVMQDQLNNDVVEDALTIGTGLVHYYFDDSYKGTGKKVVVGKLCGHTIDATDIALGNPLLKPYELDKQPFIIVKTYEDTEQVKAYAKQNGENYMMITSDVDTDEEYDSGKNDVERSDKTVCYTMYYKQDGEMHWTKVTGGATVQKPKRLSPSNYKITMYPISMLILEERKKCTYGRSALEDAISVQKAINFLYSMIAYGIQQASWPKIIAKAGALLQSITNVPGEIITDHDKTGAGDPIKYMQIPSFSGQPQNLIDNLTAALRQTTGSDQTISGEAIGANMAAAAVLALQNQAKKPNDYAEKQLYAFNKRVGKIWEQMFKAYYILPRPIIMEDRKGRKTSKEITPSDYADIKFGMTVDVGPGGDFNESIQLTVIENMYNKGDLTKYEYVKYAPNNLVPQDMKLDFEEQAEEMEQAKQMGGVPDIMSGLTPDEQAYLQQNPQILQEMGV